MAEIGLTRRERFIDFDKTESQEQSTLFMTAEDFSNAFGRLCQHVGEDIDFKSIFSKLIALKDNYIFENKFKLYSINFDMQK